MLSEEEVTTMAKEIDVEVKNDQSQTDAKNCPRSNGAKSGKQGRRGKSGRGSKAGTKPHTKGSILNDPAFYNSYPMFAQEAGRLPFGVPLGTPMALDNANGIMFSVPGAMVISFIPCPGVSTDFTSPMNRSSIHYWTQLRAIQKASAPYDHQDVTMMMMAMDSCYIFHRLMQKAYGILQNFSPLNNFYPGAILAGMGFDYGDLLKNIDDFRAYINEFAYNCGQYAMPKDVWLFSRHEQLTQTLLVDSETTRGQSYNFVPYGLWQYDNTVSTGSQLIWKPWLNQTLTDNTRHTFAEVVEYGTALIDAISNEQDFSFISGDMTALYGANNVHQLDYTPENYAVFPKYSEEMMSQIENLRMVGEFYSGYTPVISQNPSVNEGAIIFNPIFTAKDGDDENWSAWTRNFINMHMDNPTSDDVLVATRLAVSFNPSPNQYQVTLTSCGTEIVSHVVIWQQNPNTGNFRSIGLDSNAVTSVFGTDSNANIESDVTRMCLLTQFNWHPLIRWFFGPNSATANVFAGWVGDIDNITNLPDANLARMHKAALFSLFDVRSSASSSRVGARGTNANQ
nr:putative capsid [Marmot picobirnavirus]